MNLVTGATGLVGTNVVRALRRRGEPVRVLARKSSDLRWIEPLGVEVAHGDVRAPDSLREALRGVTRVYHVAGAVDLSPLRRPWLQAVNVDGVRAMCDAALAAGVRRLVLTSSTAACASGTIDAPADEETPYNMAHLRVPYLETKREGERIALAYNARGLEVVAVNPTVVLGAFDPKPTSGRLLLTAQRAGLPFYPVGAAGVVDAGDTGEAHVAAMERGRPGHRYILNGENVTHRELWTAACELLGRPPPRVRLPLGVLWPVGVAMTALGRLGVPVPGDLTTTAVRLGSMDYCVSAAKARAELGLPATSARTALENAYRWFVDTGRLPSRGATTPPRAAAA